MSEFIYKTRGDGNPRGKAKVYFCCHPEDFDSTFEWISDDILALQNCAVWYDAQKNKKYKKDDLWNLEQMQLFVIPVTKRFLTTENDALSVRYPFAREKHIPVLPILMEPGLEELFNMKCGEIQILNRVNKDRTAIHYEKQLERFLSSVLIGDELADKVRAAFDAYVFLSYRKKDRKYAQELMRLIHKNEFCRDIAIWYDEFLTPGENFNDAIKDALQKSGLFVLAVTPNLVNETNYIMTTEYPMARKEEKPILPVELVPTDKKELSAQYEGIPDCSTADNPDSLSEAMLKAVRRMAIKESASSPEHNFLIGLAYLAGIDVEIDHERAVSLITSAAEAGLVEAVKKLIDMYQNGIGVKINHHEVIRWQLKLMEYYRQTILKRKGKDIDFDEVMAYLNSMLFLGTKCFDVNSYEEALKYYEMVYDFCKKFSLYLGANADNLMAACFNNMAAVYSHQDQTAKAADYYKKAIALRKSLTRKMPEVSASDLLDTYYNLSIVYEKCGQLKKAEKMLDEAVGIYQSYGQKVDLDKRKLAAIYVLQASISQNNKTVNSQALYEKAAEIYEKQMAHPSVSTMEGYAKLNYDMGIYYCERGQTNRASQCMLTAQQYYMELFQLDQVSYIDMVVRTNYELALIERGAGKDDAVETIEKAIAYCGFGEKLGWDEWKLSALVYRVAAEIMMDHKAWDAAQAYLKKAEHYLSRLEKNSVTAVDFILYQNALGRLYYRTYKNELSRQAYGEAHDLYFQYYRMDKDKKKLIGIIYFNYALLCYHNYHDKMVARDFADKAIKVLTKAPGGSGVLINVLEFKRKFLRNF